MAKRPGIQTLRLNALMTQADFAKAMGVSVPSVQAWESGESVPRPAMARKMLTVLEVTREQLLEALEVTQRERVMRERAQQEEAALPVAAETLADTPALADKPPRKRKKD